MFQDYPNYKYRPRRKKRDAQGKPVTTNGSNSSNNNNINNNGAVDKESELDKLETKCDRNVANDKVQFIFLKNYC